jgi:hypothetical protein
MKKQTGIFINLALTVIGYGYENWLLFGAGVICLSLVLISKTKRHELKN